jgi:beta-glucosidase
VRDGSVEDHGRRAYIGGHLDALAAAMADGVDVRRYYVWSLLDNFEWEEGYGKRFGIVHVDFATQARTPKTSAVFYRDYIDRARGRTGA